MNHNTMENNKKNEEIPNCEQKKVELDERRIQIEENKLNWEQTKFEKEKKYKITAGWEKAKVFAPYILSAGVFLGSYFGYLEFQNSRRIIEIQNKNIELQTRNSIDQRFKDAIQLLGNENMGSRLGGIYALNNIAQSTRDPDSEYANYSESIFKILCSYIRDKTQDSNYQKKYKDKPSIEIQSIINILFKDTAQRVVYKKYRADLPSTYLVGADFENAALEYADFSNTSLDSANFENAQCQNANFENAQCQGADFIGAQCQGADFNSAQCQGAYFRRAQCQGALFIDAKCQGARFIDAQCQNADFSDAQCQGASFIYAKCQGARFNDAQCRYADFSGAQCRNANFREAQCQGANFTNSNLDATYLHSIGIDNTTRFDKTSMNGATSDYINYYYKNLYEKYILFYRPTSISEKDTLLHKRIKEEQKKGGVITGVLSNEEREHIFKIMKLPFNPKDSTSLNDWEYDSKWNIVKKKDK